MRTKIIDCASQWLITVVLIGFILFQHYWSIAHVPPIMDGSQHVTSVGNLGFFLDDGKWWKFISDLVSDPSYTNNFLSYLYFTLFSAVLGPGRIAWGWAWAFAVLFFTFSSLKLCRDEKIAVVLSLVFIILSSTLVEARGGILGERVDSLSILIFLLMLTSIIKERWTLAAFLGFSAVLAKGVALPLCFLAWLTAAMTGMIRWKTLFSEIKNRRLYWLTLLILILAYGLVMLKPVVNYNLGALHREGGRSSDLSVLGWKRFETGLRFYIENVFLSNPLGSLLSIASVLIVFFNRRKGATQRRVLRWGLLYFAATICIFSSHPVLETVLVVWMTPCLWIIGYALSSFLLKIWVADRLTHLQLVVLLALVCGGFIWRQNYKKGFFTFNEVDAKRWHRIETSISEIASLIRPWQSHSDNSSARPTLYIYTDFLTGFPGNIQFNYNVFRVMLLERLGKNSPFVSGWELATYTDLWRSELLRNPPNAPALLLLLVDEKTQIFPRNPVGKISGMVKAELDSMKCQPERVSDPMLEDAGRFLVYTTNAAVTQCGFPDQSEKF